MEKELPQNWIKTDLETILVRITNGSSLKQQEAPFKNSYPITRIETIADETIDLKRVKYVLPTENDIEKFSLRKGDILFSHINSDKHLGKTVIFDLDITLIHGINLLLMRSVNQYNSRLLNYLFNYYRFRGKFREVAQRAVNQSSINQKKLKKFPILLPPLPEQNRIVAKLDKLFEQVEVINERINNLREIKERFIYSCLVNTETGQFFSRQKIGEYLEEGKERIGENWSQYRKIGVSAKKGIIDLSTGQKKSFETYKVVKPGDFIYNTMRVNIGSIAIYTGKEIAITSPDYVVFRVKGFLSSELLLGFLKSEQGLLEIGANTKGSVRARLYFKSLSEIRMPVSDQKTQILAEKFLTTYSFSLRKLKKISKTKLLDLEKAVLTKAFKGELVPQLETDGDARELLREIKQLKKIRLKN